MRTQTQQRSHAPQGINFEELKCKAATKNFKPVYIDMLRDVAAMEFIARTRDLMALSSDEIRIGVSGLFQSNVDRHGGFAQAYFHGREVVKTRGIQVPERKYDLMVGLMKEYSTALDSPTPASTERLGHAREAFRAAVADWAKSISAFGQDHRSFMTSLVNDSVYSVNGVADEVRSVLEPKSKSGLGILFDRVVGIPASAGKRGR